MRTDLLIKTFQAPTAIDGYLLVKPGAADGQAAAGSASTDTLMGVTTQIGTQDNGSCDVIMAGPTEVRAGAAVSRGTWVTADSSGRAVPVGSSAGCTAGFALTSAAEADDIFSIFLAPGINPATA